MEPMIGEVEILAVETAFFNAYIHLVEATRTYRAAKGLNWHYRILPTQVAGILLGISAVLEEDTPEHVKELVADTLLEARLGGEE